FSPEPSHSSFSRCACDWPDDWRQRYWSAEKAREPVGCRRQRFPLLTRHAVVRGEGDVHRLGVGPAQPASSEPSVDRDLVDKWIACAPGIFRVRRQWLDEMPILVGDEVLVVVGQKEYGRRRLRHLL